MSRSKGNRREREAREFYERAGFWVYSPPNQQFCDTDVWGLFDLMCFRVTDGSMRFVQVKSNGASGVREWMHRAQHFEEVPNVTVDFLVPHDGEGWRLIQTTDDGRAYTCVLDERNEECSMGEHVTEFLKRGENDES